MLHWPVWPIQESIKGASLIHVINALPAHVECEGGWGINTYYALKPLYYISGYGFLDRANSLTREDVIQHPLFTPFRVEEDAMHSTNLFTIADADERYELRARFLGDAIPAESCAMGANKLGDDGEEVMAHISMMEDCMDNVDKWPRKDKNENLQWHHSDWKQLAYCFVYKLFREIVEWK